MIIGKHLIAGEWQRSQQTFRSDPYAGIGREYAHGGVAEVNVAAEKAASAFEGFACTSAAVRSDLLKGIAAEIENDRNTIISHCSDETGLLKDRVSSEFSRTVNQLVYFGDVIKKNDYLDLRHDHALPDRSPIPRPDLRLCQRPVGPVAVFGASNFPLAFSSAGGDTAAALAAGCPVIVKGHSAHPGTSDLVAQCIDRAIRKQRLDPAIFSQVQSNTFEAGQALVQHANIKAVGFTGSTVGGRALYNLCAAREEPIPFYGELGSVNPVYILPAILQSKSSELAGNWISSLLVGAGQMCTNPGVLIVLKSDAAERLIEEVAQQIKRVPQQVLLADSIAATYKEGQERFRDCPETTVIHAASCSRRSVTPAVFQTTGTALLEHDFLREEVFGPFGVIVVASSVNEILTIARTLQAQLTCTIHMDESDRSIATQLLKIVEHKAGRVIFNGFPTGVEVSDAMVHGGPYPASTNFGATSVGSLSIRRFMRPVCYQNAPPALLGQLVPGAYAG